MHLLNLRLLLVEVFESNASHTYKVTIVFH